MPTKHINDKTYEAVKKEAYKAALICGENIKESDILNLLILKGIKVVSKEDYERYCREIKK